MTPAYLTIGGCWVSSLAIGLPIMFGLNHRPEPESFFLNNFTNIREESFNFVFNVSDPAAESVKA